MEHQDWNDVILHTKKDTTQKINRDIKTIDVKKKTSVKSSQNQPSPNKAHIIEQQCENDTFHVKKLKPQTKMSIQRARQSKNLTQSQLAALCNLQTTIIRDYENGTAVPSKQTLQKIGSALGINL